MLHGLEHDAVATIRHTWGIGEGTGIPCLDLAGPRAAIARLGVSVVALLAAFDGAVAALDGRALAQLPRCADTPRTLGLAVRRTTVVVLLVAVVAHFAQRKLDDSIAAVRSLLAGRARYQADPPGFELTSAAAAIVAEGIAVVALLARFDAPVATLGNQGAGLSGDTLVAGVLNRAGGIAAVVVEGVAVIANLARADDFVAADDQSVAGPRGGTLPVGLDLANAIATIAGKHVPVVAFLGWLVDPIAAARRYLGLAAQGALGIAHIGGSAGGRAAGATSGAGRDNSGGATACSGLGTSAWINASPTASTDSSTAAANACERENCGESATDKLACGQTTGHWMNNAFSCHWRVPLNCGASHSDPCPMVYVHPNCSKFRWAIARSSRVGWWHHSGERSHMPLV